MNVLFVFAHPDDESLSSGGTIAHLSKIAKVVLICATKGEAGLVGDPPLTSQENLGRVREKEQKCAAKILGIQKIHYLGIIDGTVNKYPQQKLITRIQALIKKENPDIVITFDKHGISNHPDHIAISKATTLAFLTFAKHAKKHVRLYHATIPKSYLYEFKKNAHKGIDYSAFGEIVGTGDEEITTIVDISTAYKTKVKALHCHKTQHKDVERFLRRERYVDLNKEYFVLVSENSIV